jgi:hypothetical protein
MQHTTHLSPLPPEQPLPSQASNQQEIAQKMATLPSASPGLQDLIGWLAYALFLQGKVP